MSGTSNLTYAFRTLSKSPGFTLAVILSLALGIGANTAIFSVVNGLFFHPPGLNRPTELVAPRISYKKLGLEKIVMSATDFADIRDHQQFFSNAAMQTFAGFNYASGSSPERLQGALVSWQWFDVLGTNPLLGRGFHPEEDQPGANHVVVLSFGTWQRLFSSDRSILGRTIELNKTLYRVVGVMPSDFRWPSEADLWIPLGLPLQAYGPENRLNEDYFVVARLASGVTYARAANFMQVLSKRVLDQVPHAKESQWSMVLEPLTEYAAGNLKTPMFILLSAVALVLLMACSNIAGLMLVRATARTRDLAIRTSLGASKADLIQQALTETLLLSLFGTVLGFATASVFLRTLLLFAHTRLASDFIIHIDGYVLAFAACVGIFSAFLFGLMPAWQIARLGQHYDQLKAGGRSGTEGRQGQNFRSILVVGQIAMALVLLMGAGLLLKTLANLRQVNTGFEARRVMTASIALPTGDYKTDDKQTAFFVNVLSELAHTPGVASAAAVDTVPFSGGDPTASFSIEERIVPSGDPGFYGSARYASPQYFQALHIPLLAGRYFNENDRANSQAVAIIDVSLARRYWPNQNPLGHRLRRSDNQPWATVIGIVGHVRQSSLAADSGHGAYYFCLYQQPQQEFFLIAQGITPTAQLSEAIRHAVHKADPAQAVFDFKTMEERIALALGPQEFASKLLIVFAAVALCLAIIGLYGVISYNVTSRKREIGIRAALGAERTQILALILSQAMRLVLFGFFAGFIAAALFGRIVSTQLFQVDPFDPMTFAITACVITIAAFAATLVPAWRATRIDPAIALRND